ncbi:SDR family oxidoreductase [Chitinophaga silvisoli]|uniref:SDR family NAD(P)-dependent oxidoreductase n=1 Tax=Chitinophaga silvisoli TaxID=2291814 RepID=A0A3E1PA22_9BACT|nr:SDR family oxidoreductase [Chitinophaga silvisoli]RFM37011.1 SDR family NAD(P)-dependent oxidoreductase [Chitinophaga silvisoli]
MKTLNGKVALVTGSARGLGKAIAERFAALGADIVINYSRDKASADEVISNIQAMGVSVIAVKADVSQTTEIEHLFNEAKSKFGKIDIVVANAGVELVDVPVTEFTEQQYDRLFGINTKGAFFTLQQAAKHIADGGRIINIASSTTLFPFEGVGLYGGSKTAPKYLVEVLAKEIGHRGVTVNSIIPYAVDNAGIFTDPNEPSIKWLIEANPMKRLAHVEDVANVAEFFASELASFVNGQHLLVNGGASH